MLLNMEHMEYWYENPCNLIKFVIMNCCTFVECPENMSDVSVKQRLTVVLGEENAVTS